MRHFITMIVVGALCALVVGALPEVVRAGLIVNDFNTAVEVAQWRFDFGSAGHAESFDPSADASGNPLSGSMKVALTFNSALGANNTALETTDHWYPGLNGADYSGIKFDLKIDPNSAVDSSGNNGSFQLAIRNTDNYNYIPQFSGSVRAADGWRHIEIPLTGPFDHIRALTWQLYGGPSQNINGTVTLWIDNIEFTTAVPEPSSVVLAALGLLGLVARGWRRRRR